MTLLLAVVPTLVMIGVFLFFWRDTRARARLQRRLLRVLATGQAASGQILRMEPTGKMGGTKAFPILELSLDVEVQLPGMDPYMVKTRQLVDQHRLASVQPRQIVFLRVDRKNRKQIALTDTPGEEVDPSYREAPGGGKNPSVGAATPLFHTDRLRQSDLAVVLAFGLLSLAMIFIALRFGVDWEALSPPPGGFCAAAARCCERIPQDPGVEAVVKQLTPGLFTERCVIPSDRGDASCKGLYKHYVKQAAEHQIRCD
ncbi:MAG: hypothetical protein MUF64_00950 [Polyangiaceae bacterium]|nr:hypothetical protein [Polyangiaceae bacterium]